MSRRRWLLLALLLVVGCAGSPRGRTPRRLAVLLYPYVPEAAAQEREIAAAFAALRPGVTLAFVHAADYYGGALADADVIELDTVLLPDAVAAGRVRPLPTRLRPFLHEALPLARAAAQVDGEVYGLPRWLCGLFFFHRASDTALATAQTLPELARALGGAGLLLDLTGSTTLGELYLWGLVQARGFAGVTDLGAAPEPAVIDWLRGLRALCPPGLCRSRELHAQPGAYGRAFALGQGRAVLGYSELLHAVLAERRCGAACPRPDDLAVRAVPGSTRPVAWVDALVLGTGCRGACEEDAAALLSLLWDEALTRRLLAPPGAAPRYLLPARASLYEDPALLRAAPLYPRLRALLEGAQVPRRPGLARDLRALGRAVDSVMDGRRSASLRAIDGRRSAGLRASDSAALRPQP